MDPLTLRQFEKCTFRRRWLCDKKRYDKILVIREEDISIDRGRQKMIKTQ